MIDDAVCEGEAWRNCIVYIMRFLVTILISTYKLLDLISI